MYTTTPKGAPTAPITPAAAAAGQTDKVSGAQVPPAEGQPGSQGEQEAARLQSEARQQAALRARQRQREERERAVQAQRAKIEADLAESQRQNAALAAKIARFKSDPYGAALDEGLTADQFGALMLEQPELHNQKISVLEQKLAKAQEQIEKLLSGNTEQQTLSREAAKRQIRHDIKAAVKADASLEAMAAYGDDATEAAVLLIEKTFDEEGVVMDISEAIASVEEELVEQSLKAARIGKVKARMTPAEAKAEIEAAANAAPSAAGRAPAQSNQKTQMKTLSSAMVPAMTGRTTAAERRARAILAFEGKLA